jgi:hypothetical protein
MLTQTMLLLVAGGGFAVVGLWRKYGHILAWAVPLGFGAAIGLFAMLRFALDVLGTALSVDGLLWSFGFGPPVAYAPVVRGITLVLTVELLVGVSFAVDRFNGEDHGWLRAHVRLLERLWLASRWLGVSVWAAVTTRLASSNQKSHHNSADEPVVASDNWRSA